jgi:hypothetical protein
LLLLPYSTTEGVLKSIKLLCKQLINYKNIMYYQFLLLTLKKRIKLRHQTCSLKQIIMVGFLIKFNALEQTYKSEHYHQILVDWFGPELLVR